MGLEVSHFFELQHALREGAEKSLVSGVLPSQFLNVRLFYRNFIMSLLLLTDFVRIRVNIVWMLASRFITKAHKQRINVD
jgi:hypothetical protein